MHWPLHHKISRLVVRQRLAFSGLAILFAGGLVLNFTHASTPNTSGEAESGTLASCASSINDSSASNSKAVQFGNSCSSGSTNPAADAGASLPISYNLSSLTGTVIYVSPTGSDSGSGSVSSPYATLAKAISVAPSGANIVLRGGSYHEGNLSVNKTLTITAYPGETPKFDGSMTVSSTSGWTSSGNLSYRSYTPMPVTDGSGISFTTCQNQPATDCVGRYPDQVWVGASQYQQVYSKSEVTSGKFWVDQTNDQLYMETADLTKGTIAVSSLRTFALVTAPNVTLKGFEVIRYSDTASDNGVIRFDGGADNSLMDNMYISDTAFIPVKYGPGNDTNENSTIEYSTIRYSNWMGVNANQTTHFTISHSDIGHMNQFDEFVASPQSGSLKTSRTWYTQVLDSKISDNTNTNGLWFDESNYKVTVAGNDIENIDGSSLFFEISDYLYAVDNYIKAPAGGVAVRAAGSSDLYFVNNTLIGGWPMEVLTDSRSVPGCSDPSHPVCPNSISSNQDHNAAHPHPATLTWMPSINLMLNNIIAYPDGGNCYGTSVSVDLCITQTNPSNTTTVDLNTIIHPADSDNDVPQTYIDGDIYAPGTGKAVEVQDASTTRNYYGTGMDFANAMANPPVSISSLEANGYTGNQYVNTDGSPTAALQNLFNNAVPVPDNSAITPYIPAGTKHYGVTWQ